LPPLSPRRSASIAVVAVWGVAFGAFPTLTLTVMLRASGDATDAAAALVNATTNVGIAGGALLGSRLLGVVAVPGLAGSPPAWSWRLCWSMW